MLFVGHTRFSLFEPGSSSWVVSAGDRFKTEEEYRRHLFSEERLGARTDIFLGESLPQIEAAIGDHHVRHVVSYSDNLPPKYQEKLEQAAARFPFLVLDKHVNGKPSISLTDVAMAAIVDTESVDGIFGRYRLDDDDLLPITYFDQMAQYLTRSHVGWMVSLGAGYTGIRLNDHYYNVREAYYPMLAIGLLAVCRVTPGGKLLEPLGAPHAASDRANPVILDSRSPGYFWAKHPQQDTAVGRGSLVDLEVLTGLDRAITRYPPATDMEKLAALFPTVSDKLHIQSAQIDEATNLVSTKLALDQEPLQFPCERTAGMLGISGTLEISGLPRKNNALLSFEFTRQDGSPLSNEDDYRIRSAGMSKSGNPDIGYYRYLETKPGVHDFQHTYGIPDGLSCRKVSVRKFGSSKSEIKLTGLSFYDPYPL